MPPSEPTPRPAAGELWWRSGRLLAALLAFSTVLGVALWIEWSDSQLRAQERHQVARTMLGNLSREIASDLHESLGEARSLADWIAIHPEISEADFDAYSRRLLERHPSLRSTTLLPHDRIARAYPPSPGLLGLDVRAHPVQGAAVREMDRRGSAVVTGPVRLVQGGTGFVLRAPVWVETPEPHYYGHVSLVFDVARIESHLDRIGAELDLDLTLTDADGTGPTGGMRLGRTEPRTNSVDSTELEIAGERWRLTAAPRHPQPAFPGSWLRVAVAALLALIAGVGTWILLETTARLRRQNLLLEELATIDTLTGVANRRVTLLTAERAFALARRTGHALTLLVVDLDHFKSVNDRYGHQAGDAVLRAAAGAMSAVVRATDLVGRIGGEEFLIVAPGTGLEGAAQLAQRLLHRVEDTDVTFGRTKIAITASAGMATLTTEDRDIEDLIARADAGLYQAKHAGRNQAMTSLLPEEPSQVIPLRRRGP